jgi:hypothetical protein
MSFKPQLKFIDRDKLTLAEYLETEFLQGLDYGQGAPGWKKHELERQNREKGLLPKPRLSDKFITGLDSIPWGVFEQAMADALERAPDIVTPYLRTFLSIPRRPMKESLEAFGVTYTMMRTIRKDAIALIRGCLPIKARRTVAIIEKLREEEDRLLSKTKRALRKEAQQLLDDVLRGD